MKPSLAMKQLNWQSISWNLMDARGEMSHMLARVQCAAFGKVCDADLADWEELALQEEREQPLGRHELYQSMHYIGRHLNRAWNGRHASSETTDWRERHDVSRWERFPAHSLFDDLRPAPPPLRRICRFPANAPIDAKAVHPYLPLAYRKLERLCDLAAKAFEASRNPAAPPLDEVEFGHQLHRIYEQLTLVWRNSSRASSASRAAAARRRTDRPQTGGLDMVPFLAVLDRMRKRGVGIR